MGRGKSAVEVSAWKATSCMSLGESLWAASVGVGNRSISSGPGM